MIRSSFKYVVAFAAGVLITSIGHAAFWAHEDFGVNTPRPIDLPDLKTIEMWSTITRPIDIDLRIMERTKFLEIAGKGIAALAYPYRDRCQIVIPAGWTIEAWPNHGAARWHDERLGELFAHEILHCLHGRNWHPVPQ